MQVMSNLQQKCDKYIVFYIIRRDNSSYPADSSFILNIFSIYLLLLTIYFTKYEGRKEINNDICFGMVNKYFERISHICFLFSHFLFHVHVSLFMMFMREWFAGINCIIIRLQHSITKMANPLTEQRCMFLQKYEKRIIIYANLLFPLKFIFVVWKLWK